MNTVLLHELQASIRFFLDHTNLNPRSPGYGLTVDSTKDPHVASIAATGFALTAWVIASERGILPKTQARDITRGTLDTLLHRADHQRGFFAHYLHMGSARRWGKCEYSTIDTALCLNGVITAAAYFQDTEIREPAQELLERVDWRFIIFEEDGKALFHMAYNPDDGGDYVHGKPGFIGRWDMAAEQKMMYLQSAGRVEPTLARRLYHGFRRDIGRFDGHDIIINPGGTLFAYHFSEAWLDTARYLDPDGIDWFENTRLACLANRQFCIEHAAEYKTYHACSWGLSAGDSPWGYEVAGSRPCLGEPYHTGTVSIYSALSCLPFTPDETLAMVEHLYYHHPQTWGEYGFFDSYNLAVDPPWYSQALYGIDKGCSLLMIENYLSGLVWAIYTNSEHIQNALNILGFRRRARKGPGDRI
ncbi:MAG: glucoamylase family protein [Anaerolineales bacterium]|nr:glucoamylase family protein [Anaerolineales bacterium]